MNRAVKMSILTLYSRIESRRTSATGIVYRVIIWVMIVFVSLYTIAYVFVSCPLVAHSGSYQRRDEYCASVLPYAIDMAVVD